MLKVQYNVTLKLLFSPFQIFKKKSDIHMVFDVSFDYIAYYRKFTKMP